MNHLFLHRFGAVALLGTLLAGSAVAAPAAKKSVAKKPVVKLKPGIKKTPQMAGAVGRFGELYGLKSGWTFQILSARTSFDAFDDYSSTFPDSEQKLLVLQIGIKNNTTADLYFDTNSHQFQLQDSAGQTFNGGNYRLSSLKAGSFSPTLKPGQEAGQGTNKLEVAIPIPATAQISKIIFQQGRKGTRENVTRFFVAGTQGGDAKNVITKSKGDGIATPVKADGFFPSRTFAFRVNSVTFSMDAIAGSEVPENRRFAIVNLTVKNTTSVAQSSYDFYGTAIEKMAFTDADGESYPASSEIGLLKASADEPTSSEFAPGAEKAVRVVFPVPQSGELKTLSLGASGGKFWVFDASGWK